MPRENLEPDFEPTVDEPGSPATEEGNMDPTRVIPAEAYRTDRKPFGVMTITSTALPPMRGLGDFEILSEIARGGMGVVYKARQKSLDRIVALKMILHETQGAASIKRFELEARAAAALDHPGIVPIYEIGQSEGKPYYTMAFVEGLSLSARVRRNRPTPLEAVALLLPVVDAVGYAHKHQIIHRDLKPQNILIDAQGRPRVTDFGLAKRGGTDVELTLNGQIVGTPSYMAPEQASGGKRPVGPEADIYALGAILHFMLIGKAPFTGDNVAEVLAKVINEAPKLPRTINPEVPEVLNNVVARCLQKEPGLRYHNTTELADVLRAFLRAHDGAVPVSADRTILEPTQPATRPRRALGTRTRLLILVAIAALGGFAYYHQTQRPSEGPAVPPAPVQANPETPKAKLVFRDTLQNDFGLDVQLLGGKVDEKGVHHFVEGDHLRFKIKVDEQCYVGIWSVDQEGKVDQLFPNEIESHSLFVPTETRVLPGKGVKVVYDTVPSMSAEQIRVVASVKKPDPAQGMQVGSFTTFRGAQVEELKRTVRAVIVRGKVAEASIPYFVNKKK